MKIKSMAISPNEEYLAVGTDRNDLGICYVNSIGFGQEPKTGIEEHIHREVKYDIVAQGFHQGKVYIYIYIYYIYRSWQWMYVSSVL